MIETHLQIVSDLSAEITPSFQMADDYRKINTKGREVFKIILRERLTTHSDKKPLELYKLFYEEYGLNFGHYFRFLYRMVDTINRQNFVQELELPSGISSDEKNIIKQQMNFDIQYEYVNIIRALLSDDELEILFLNMIYFKDLKFKPLIEKYVLLKNIGNIDKKLNNKEYNFHPVAILKEQNPNFK